MDAEDFNDGPANDSGGETTCDGDDATNMSDRPIRAYVRPGRAGKRGFCGNFGGRCSSSDHRRSRSDGTMDARCQHGDAGSSGGSLTRLTKNDITGEKGDRRTQRDRTHKEAQVGRDEGPVVGKAMSRAADTIKKENIFGHLRVGEAKNPGPEQQTEGTGPVLPWSGERPQDKLRYPVPHRPGFRDIITPGCQPDGGADNEAGDKEHFALRAETVNATAWGPLKKRLRRTKAHIILAQETKITEAAMAAASAWSLRNGWKMVAAPAIKGKKGGASGGGCRPG